MPWTLDGAIAKLPEVYTEAVTPETVEQYTQLLSALPEEAQWWITGMGWGLEDLTLDANEVALLELLAEKNVPTAMSILTSPDVIDGVTWGEVAWAQEYEAESLAALLQDDVDELLAEQLLSEEGLAGINELIEMAVTKFEIAKGLYLVDSFGVPNGSLIEYQVPSWNTSLCALGYSSENGIPDGYEVTAIARAMNAGTWLAIAEPRLHTDILGYYDRLLQYQAETDRRLGEVNAAWSIHGLTLEGQLPLSGSVGLLYPGRPGEFHYNKDFQLDGILASMQSRPMDRADWDYVSADITRLGRIRDHLLSHLKEPLLSSSVVETARFLSHKLDEGQDYVSAWDRENPPATVDIEGRKVPIGEEYAADWGLDSFDNYITAGKRYVGNSGQAWLLRLIYDSIGVSAIEPWGPAVHNSAVIDPLESKIIAPKATTEIRDYSVERQFFSFKCCFPWDGFHLYAGFHAQHGFADSGHRYEIGELTYAVSTTELLPAEIWESSNGIPTGYTLRGIRYLWRPIQELFLDKSSRMYRE